MRWVRPDPGTAVGLACAGTFVVYNVDRLRDLERDRHTAPLRSAFVSRHRSVLVAVSLLASIASVALVLRVGPVAGLLLAPVLAAGLLHRRLKRFALAKPLYITAAWVAVVVGLPLALGGATEAAGRIAALVGAAILGNAIASNVRDGESAASRLGSPVPMRLALGLAAAGLGVALLLPTALRPLAIVPLTTGVALAAFYPGERYGLVVVDGALLLGALGALPLLPA